MSTLPVLRHGPVRPVRQDHNHNAFTDLCIFGGRIFLTFRSCPDGHMVFDSSRIVVLVSDDGDDWTEVFTFAVDGRDTRDPHFLVFNDRLFVYTGTWLVPPEGTPRNLNDHLGYAVWSADGQTWSGPQMLEGTYGHYIWRAATHGGRAYLCGRRRRLFDNGIADEQTPKTIEAALLESDDGLVWRYRTLFKPEYGDETAFLFEDDGTVVALVRDGAREHAHVCRTAPPWTDWTRTPLQRNVGGPLLVRWGAHYLVGGRKQDVDGTPSLALYWLAGDRLHEAAVLPSGGDCSYPGFVAFDDGRGLLSYYSSHEGSTAVYVTELRLD